MPELSRYYKPELTLPDLLKRAAVFEHPLFIGYVDETGSSPQQTYAQLYDEARRITIGLNNLGLKKGDKVIIATLQNRETITLLWGCFLGGMVPTVLQPPMTFSGYNPAVVKLMNVFNQLEQPYIFMSSEMSDLGELPSGKVVTVQALNCSGAFADVELFPEDLAFIQFSSGSTGDPKGVMLTHHNMMVNLDAIRIGLDLHFPDHTGNWMPLFHDMGLIGYHLTPMYSFNYQSHIETIDFIKNPGLWLDLMSNAGIAVTGCPNFGLALVLRHLKRRKIFPGWNFAPMKAMLNGAEPISVQIMNDFVETLQPFGFHPEAMMPVYGMAEATLAISFTPLMQPSAITAFDTTQLDREHKAVKVADDSPGARLLSGVGVALNDTEIRIVDHTDSPVEDATAGHIQLKGPGITKGYFKKPEATQAAFCGEWLRTGDIGFFFEGNLYVSGRHKDIIFKNGRNYFANDLEIMACTIEEISYGKVCFGGTTSKETGHDKVIAFLAGSPGEKTMETFRQLRNLLRANLGITVDELIMVKSNEIPKTSSGKLQRYKLMQRYHAGEFDAVRLIAEK
ncbi:MAG: AMP-binding protein [Candidatus Cloacimonetes bacterium]|nr:AMP-binding protein [Candidatus Cloacimonadota bacterium]